MIRRLFLLLAAVLSAPALQAETLPPLKGEPVLTITLDGVRHELDAEGLRSLPATTFTTTTIWTEGEQTFTGVRMTELLARLGVDQGDMALTAANDYQITVPVTEFTGDGALLAYDRNGAAMTLRDKGPLWVVYPYDSDPKFRSEIVYSNSIWQLDRISITR